MCVCVCGGGGGACGECACCSVCMTATAAPNTKFQETYRNPHNGDTHAKVMNIVHVLWKCGKHQ
jgi:hypothetical protein